MSESAGPPAGEPPSESAGTPAGAGEAPSDPTPAESPEHRLDPDLAAKLAGGSAQPGPVHSHPVGRSPQPVIDTRPYRWMIGIFGLILVVAVSAYQFATHGVGTTGVPAGQRLHYFAAPLAASTLNGDANLNPPCTLARHDPRALNICLLAGRVPLVLAFFVTGSSDCTRQVDTLQALSSEFPATAVQFAAVAVHASHTTTAALVRSHHWTIPIAYDPDGSVGAVYGVAICPMLELAYRGGIVKDRLIGDDWLTMAALAPKIRALLGST